ncbi:hypothetical protein Q0590_06170 [Rhodocytophaga aerolata]|uniref:Uncharacterized protein n=1 Tax=Rhodocytophaga aerolata TaxID=455078 RepID=A0ABT8R4Y2_9BACT|nr:hypothetical protein [Rhodocytophaga aerolata]MDO1445827.1 hypothetical protein [Rhodocytophaga aerolata]
MILSKKKTPVYQKIVFSITEYLKKKGYENIQAQGIDEYQDPAHITRKGADESFTPDLTARRDGSKHYFEVVDYPKKDKNLIVSKWMILSTLAKQLNGKLHLMVPHGQMSFTNRIIQSNNIDAQVLSLKEL